MPIQADLPALGEAPIVKGEALVIDFTIDTPSDTIDGWTVMFTCRNARGQVLLQTPLTVLDPDAKTVRLAFLSGQTQRVAAGTYPYDIWRIDTGSETCLRLGRFTLTQDTYFP